ncbi:MAG: DUF2652 domain-containing protein [Gammaproteobacteria bacterium]
MSDAEQSGGGAAGSAFFAIADITGYTGYLANNELDHAQGILAEFTELLIDELSEPFRFVELEGDAVFVFAPPAAVDDAERLVDIFERCYQAFTLLKAQMVANTNCTCRACRAIEDLDLKFVAHFGSYLPQPTPTGTKLVGPDVIITHRLLKNHVTAKTGVRAYAFLTEAFVERVTLPGERFGGTAHGERYDELGAIHGRVLDLADAVSRRDRVPRHYVAGDAADFCLATTVPAPPSLVWAYHIDAGRRLRWQNDTTSVENTAAPDGRTGIGSDSYCDHGSYRLNHRIVDWRPFEYMTMDTTPTGRALIKPPRGLATFEFEDLGDGRSRVWMRMRAHDRGPLTRALLRLARPLLEKTWAGHYARLIEVIEGDRQAASAQTPTAPGVAAAV